MYLIVQLVVKIGYHSYGVVKFSLFLFCEWLPTP